MDGNVPADFVPRRMSELSLTRVISALVTLHLMGHKLIATNLPKRAESIALLFEFLEVVSDEIPKVL